MATELPNQNYTFNKLVEVIKSYSERNDQPFLDQIPGFITLAENRLATQMKQQGFQAVVRGTFDPGYTLKKPAFWRETISFSYLVNGEWKPLFLRSLEYLKEYWPIASATSAPAYYADYNVSNFYIAPTPPQGYDFELVYYARLDPLTESHQENWLTLNAPQALVYACLLESALWRKNATEQGKWQQQYAEAMQTLLAENRERLADRNSGVRPT